MIASKGLRWSGNGISNSRQRLATAPRNTKSFSTKLSTSNHLRSQPLTRSPRLLTPRSIQQSRSISLFGWGSSKPSVEDFTAKHSAPDAITPSKDVLETSGAPILPIQSPRSFKASHATSDAPDPSISIDLPRQTLEPKILQDLENSIAAPHPQTTSGILDDVDISSIPESIGYLKNTCGLDYGWGATATLEYLLEHIHITAGLSWALSIPVLAIICRMLVFRAILKGSDVGAKMRDASPVLKPLRDRYVEAAKAKDNALVLQLRTEMRAVNNEYGISMWRMFLPMLLQIPLQFGGFRLLRGMSTLPVPAFETESWLWTSDLTMGDPFYILPVVAGGVLYLNLKQTTPSSPSGGSAGGFDPATLQNMLKVGLPAMSFVFLLMQPGAVQLFFVTNSFLALGQQSLMQNPTTRAWLGLYPNPKPSAPSASRPGGLSRYQQNTIKEDSPKEVANSENTSLIDRIIDKGKQQKDALIGTAQSRQEKHNKGAYVSKAEQYEAKRRQDLEMERENRNQRQLSKLSRTPRSSRPGLRSDLYEKNGAETTTSDANRKRNNPTHL